MTICSPPDPGTSAAADPPAAGDAVFWKWRPYARSRWALGVDVGRQGDPSALALVERVQWYRVRGTGGMAHRPAEVEYRLAALRRLPLGTDYVTQACIIAGVLARPELEGCVAVLDASGVGRGVVDLLARTVKRLEAVTLTAGAGWSRDRDGWKVSKTELVSRFDALLAAGEFKASATLAEAGVLRAELHDFTVGATAAGTLTFGARSGRHDDALLATMLATWWLGAGAGSQRQVVGIKGI